MSAKALLLQVLSWLKSWDSAVFGVTKGAKAGMTPAADASADKRPEQKALLLAGSPGAILIPRQLMKLVYLQAVEGFTAVAAA